MPSWNEKPHAEPTINVNLKPCTHIACLRERKITEPHAPSCPGAPVLIPCPLPRSFTVKVALGECNCFGPNFNRERRHAYACRANPVSVSCSIAGRTWEESKVVDVGFETEPHDSAQWPTFESARICTDRWALVQALVLGKVYVRHPTDAVPGVEPLFAQRDAVYAALAEEARLETDLHDAQHRSHAAMPSAVLGTSAGRIGSDPALRHSAAFLAAYVEYLIEQVGVLGVSP